ncbi:MAG: membrane protein insertion efficiency factor YidD [Burkholderiaceae bacterium]
MRHSRQTGTTSPTHRPKRPGAMVAGARKAVQQALRHAVRAYQYAISPWLAPSCRFLPTCSDYALVALETHGAAKGSWLALRRVCRCHPWCSGGWDPVPPRQ